MFGKIAWFEFRYQLKSPVLWAAFVIFFLIGFGVMSTDRVAITGGGGGNTHINGPGSIMLWTLVMSLFTQFAAAAFAANVVIRDEETGFGPILYSTRVTKASYLFGRFAGAFGACLIFLLAVPLALIVGAAMPWHDPERIGPFTPWHYIYAYLVAGAPVLFTCTAMFFAMATATRSMMGTYLCVVGFFVLYIATQVVLSRPEFSTFVSLIDPYGIGAMAEQMRYWTVSDRNSTLPAITLLYLGNRAIWTGVAVAALAGAYFIFNFDTRAAKQPKAKKEKQPSSIALVAPETPKKSYGLAAQWGQALTRTRFEFGYVLGSPAYLILLLLGVIFSGFVLWNADALAGTATWPATRVLAQALRGAFGLFPLIIAIYYAGELVWRDREKRADEIVDSTPASDWTFAVPKVLALWLVLVSALVVSVATSMGVQLAKGYANFQIAEYLNWYLFPVSVGMFELAALAVFLQALSPNKFVGWGLMLVYIVGRIVAITNGFDHPLYLYGINPSYPVSEMDDHAFYWIGATWFETYWSGVALLLVVMTHALWRRGVDTRLTPRLGSLPHRLMGATGIVAALVLVAAAGSGGWIYYNTNVLNRYTSSTGAEQWRADLERTLLRYEHTPEPRVTDVTLNVALYPREHYATATGSYVIENRTGAALSEIDLFWPIDLRIEHIAIDGARLATDFATHHPSFPFQVWHLDQPMAPGEKRQIHFTTRAGRPGFGVSGGQLDISRVTDNGSFINDTDISPMLGFNRNALLQGRAIRRRYHLPPDLRMPKLEDDAAVANNYLRRDSDWVNADVTLSTDADQIPVAPGYVVSDHVANGRHTTRFRTDAPIMHFISLQSARFAVRHSQWNNVDLAVYYDPRHGANVDRMLRAMSTSLALYNQDFSPFQFHQMRVLEFPAYASFAQSFANTVPYSENIGFLSRFDERTALQHTDKVDFVTYVTAHEVAHQWWAHQIIGSEQQGSTMLSETFAQYSAMLVMEHLYGPDQMRRFLRYQLDQYLQARGSETVEELPLNRVENQPYIHYNKGALVMYFLKNEIGEAAVNRALQRLLARYAFHAAPYPRSSDFIAILREEAGPQYQDLISDLFERITLYDARVVSAVTRHRPDGRWDVTMTVSARKFYANGQGKESEARLNEPFEIGVFSAQPGEGAFSSHDVLAFERRPIHTGTQTLTFTVAREPKFAGIDPYNKRIDRNSDDNVAAVTQSH